MKPPRFTLRILLVAVTIVAVGLGVWRLWPMSEGITESQALAVKIQMTRDEVEAIAGLPIEESISGMSMTWTYYVAAPVGIEPGRLVVVFGNGRASGIRRQGRGGFVLP